jgi:hypothetical protein
MAPLHSKSISFAGRSIDAMKRRSPKLKDSAQKSGQGGDSQDSGQGSKSKGSGQGGDSQDSGQGSKSKGSGQGGDSQDSGQGSKSKGSGQGGNSKDSGKGGKTAKVGGNSDSPASSKGKAAAEAANVRAPPPAAIASINGDWEGALSADTLALLYSTCAFYHVSIHQCQLC